MMAIFLALDFAALKVVERNEAVPQVFAAQKVVVKEKFIFIFLY
jgi:hypothetical protein